MPIPGLHDKALNQEKQLMPQIFADQQDNNSRSSEDVRRRATQVSAPAIAPTPAATPQTPQQSINGPANPTSPAVIDRLHKEAGSVYGGYVFVGHDHDASEVDQMPPQNPGYRSVSTTASSITDALAKAIVIAGLLPPNAVNGIGQNDGRVIVIVLGGRWKENVTLTSPNIDLMGMGRPVILGNLHIAPNVTGTTIRGFEFYGKATVDSAPVTGIGLIPSRREWLVRFEDCIFRGDQVAFETFRPIYARHCEFWQEQPQSTTLETAPFIVHGSVADTDWSIAENCRFVAYTDRAIINIPLGGPIPVIMSPPVPQGYAIKGTTRVSQGGIVSYAQGVAGLTHQTLQYYIVPTTGLRLKNCEVEGSLLNEGFTVQHLYGTQHAGAHNEHYPQLGSGPYVRSRGWAIMDPLTGRIGQIPARTFFDKTVVTARTIGDFVPDPTQSSPNCWGGKVNFRNSLHLSPGAAIGTTTFVNMGSVAEADIIDSMTNAPNWSVTGVTTQVFGSTSANVGTDMIYDPYNY